eukprot:scaffold1803_cov150-Skeletonema_marinoi.AAC.18
MSLCCWSLLTNLAGNKKDIVGPPFWRVSNFWRGLQEVHLKRVGERRVVLEESWLRCKSRLRQGDT